jgi:hypothetical protein
LLVSALNRECTRRGELRARQDALGQLKVIADIEKLDRVPVILGKVQKGAGARGDDAAAQLQCLRDRTRRGLPDFEIGKDNRLADRHAGEELGVGKRPHEMDARRQVARVRTQQFTETALGGEHQRRRALLSGRADPVIERRVDVGVAEQ